MKIYDLKVNYQREPLGISLSGLNFSWKIKDTKGTTLSYARVRIAEDAAFEQLCYDSGEGAFDGIAFHPEMDFVSGRRYYWQVSAVDDEGEQGVSAVSTFEGGHPDEPWHGCWIGAPFAPELHPVFQRSFHLDAVCEAARLYICGLGLYEVYINGEKVGDEYLTPYFTDYRYWTEYQTYDVKPYLKAGDNRIDVYLGNGWYKGKFGYTNKGELRNYYGDAFKLLADLYLYGADGAVQVLGTDESWLALKSPVAVSGIYDGEMYDARMDKSIAAPRARQRLFARCVEAPKTELLPMIGVGVKHHETLKVKEILTTKLGETVLDFGQEISGWVQFVADAPLGTRIILQYGEVLQDGCFYRDNLRTAKAEHVFISDGSKKTARPHFTFYGFRYVKVTGMQVDASNVGDFEAWALYSDLAETGSIETSDAQVNRLIQNTKWSEKDNFVDIPTDCPQRDERCGWTGDAQIFSAAASYHMETPAFFRKYLKDMLYEQAEKDGAVPYVVPDILTVGRERCGEPPYDMAEDLWGEAGASVWGDAATIIPWNLYQFYGNQTLLSEQYPNMKAWTDFIIHMDETHCGGERLWTCGFHFGDWLSLDTADANDPNDREGGTDKHLVASIYYMHSAELTAKAARILGKTEDACYYEGIAREVRAAVRKRYMTAAGILSVDTQTAYVIGLHFHIFEDAELETAAAQLKRLLERHNDHLVTGFVGTGYLCQALTQAGLSDKAFTLLLNEDYPSWLYEVRLGATTIWERWNSLLPDGSISSTGMNSLNHYAYGAIAEWLYQDVCGLKRTDEGVGFCKVIFSPHTDARLQHAKARYEAISGDWEAGWERVEVDGRETLRLHLTIPFNCEAVFVPEKTYQSVTLNGEKLDTWENLRLGSGQYVFEVA